MKRLSVIALAVAVCCLTSWTAVAGPETGKIDRKSKAWKKKVAAYRARVADQKAKRKAAREKRSKRKTRTRSKKKAKASTATKKAGAMDTGATPSTAGMDAEIPAPPATAKATDKPPTGTTPLNLRPTKKPATLKKEPKESNWWYKGIFLFIAVAGGVLILRKRGGRFKLPQSIVPQLKVVARTSLGVRSELVVAEIDGMRILLGVTPNGISRIENLGAARDEDESALLEEPMPERATRKVAEPPVASRRNSLFDEDDNEDNPSPASFQNALANMQRRLEKHENRRESSEAPRDSRRAPARPRKRMAAAARSTRGGGQARSLLRAVRND